MKTAKLLVAGRGILVSRGRRLSRHTKEEASKIRLTVKTKINEADRGDDCRTRRAIKFQTIIAILSKYWKDLI